MPNDFQELAAMVALRDPAAAPRLRDMAERLNGLADELETQGFRDSRGVADRCKLAVVGPDGEIRQQTDTGAI